MIKEIKRRRLPKEVLFLIDILNDKQFTIPDVYSNLSIWYDSLVLFTIDKNVINPRDFNILTILNEKFDLEIDFHTRRNLYKDYTEIALQNSIYEDYEGFNKTSKIQ